MTNLDLARELLEGLDLRRDARNEARNLGEWQTELNEVARILHYLLAHMGGQVPSVSRRCCGADDDDMDANTHG